MAVNSTRESDQSLIEREVSLYSSLVGIDTPAIDVHGYKKITMVKSNSKNGVVLSFSSQLLEAPKPVVRFVLAHEVAHIACNHLRRRETFSFILGAILISLFCLLASMVVSAPHLAFHQLILIMVLSCALLGYQFIYSRSSRVYEIEADVYASTFLDAPLTESVSEWITEHFTETRKLFRSHPTWSQRVAIIDEVTGPHY